jgi:hypothetical protein
MKRKSNPSIQRSSNAKTKPPAAERNEAGFGAEPQVLSLTDDTAASRFLAHIRAWNGDCTNHPRQTRMCSTQN